MRSVRLSRRTLLRGAGGLGVGLPLLEVMQQRRALAAAGAPKRLVVLFTPNGTNTYGEFMPSAIGADFTLGSETSPLLPLRKDLLVLSGIDMKSAMKNADGDLHSIGMSHMLTAVRAIPAAGAAMPGGIGVSFAGGPSIDQRIASEVGAATRFPSLEFGVQSILGIGPHPFSRMSYKDKQQPVPAEDDPRAMFKRLFSDLVPPAGAANGTDMAREQRRSVLDFVQDDYRRLQPRLSTRDRQKVDVHLAALREIELRLAKPVGAACKRPDDPAATITNPNDAKSFPDIGKVQMDLLVLALACDLTRVASLQWSWARSMTAFPWISVRDAHHDLTHGSASPTLSRINNFYAQQVAYFVTALKAQNELGGTLLDSSVVWWCSDVSFGGNHSFANIRAFLFGSCGGFFKTGQHIKMNGESHTRLMVTLMHAMGSNGQQFGDPTLPQGPLPGIG